MKFIIAIVLLFVAIASAKEVWEGKVYKLYEANATDYNMYLKELDIGYFKRLAATSSNEEVELKKLENNKYSLHTKMTFAESTNTFELGKEFDEKRIEDGIQVKSVITLEGNKLIQNQDGIQKSTIIREFGPTEMVATMTVNKVVCTRKFKIEK